MNAPFAADTEASLLDNVWSQIRESNRIKQAIVKNEEMSLMSLLFKTQINR